MYVMNNEYNIELVDVKEINVQDLGNRNVKMEIYDTEGSVHNSNNYKWDNLPTY